MQILDVTFRTARELGLKPLLQLGVYRLMHRSGLLRWRTANFNWDSKPLDHWLKTDVPSEGTAYIEWREGISRKFFFDEGSPLLKEINSFHVGAKNKATSRAQRILEGFFPLFGDEEYELGFPPVWNSFPLVVANEPSLSVDPNSHWTTYDIEAFPQDVRLLWEPSRFGWAFTLARAYLLTHEPKFVDGFWELLESWKRENPPYAGPQWISAQEAAIRILALVFSFYAFQTEFKSNPRRITSLAQMIAVHADRIPPTIAYSRAQGNNHLLLEAVALYTVGLLFPEFEKSGYLHKLGRGLFIEGIRDQVFPDGGYIQHSTNYHRFALAASAWLLRLADINGEVLPGETRKALSRSARCLDTLIDPTSGKVPNLGHNDGAYLFPLTNCTFQDYRPTTILVNKIFGDHVSFPAGRWDELLHWFGLSLEREQPESHDLKNSDQSEPWLGRRLHHQREPSKRTFPQAGLQLLCGADSWGMLRCAEFTTRPAHSDQLHLDLWWRAENILRDAGTYLYNGKKPWRNNLASSFVHNSPLVDELEPMDRAGTFLWLNWSKGKILEYKTSDDGSIEILAVKHNGYRKIGVSVCRTVIRAGDQIWHVIDEIEGGGSHSVQVGWLLPDADWAFEDQVLELKDKLISISFGPADENLTLALVRAGEQLIGDHVPKNAELLGWHSPNYARRDPALTFLCNISGPVPLRILTTIVLGDADSTDLEVQHSEMSEGNMGVRSVRYLGEYIEI